jgi:hypothetical protein
MHGLVLRDGVDIGPPLLQTLIDLYLQKPSHTVEEERHFTELALRLLKEADIATRMAAARRLTSYSSAPMAVMQHLAGDVPEVVAIIDGLDEPPRAPPAQLEALRQPPSVTDLSELFFASSADERRLILVNLTYAVPERSSGIAPAPSPEAGRQLEAAALSRNPDAFMRGLEQWLGISPALAYRIVRDPLGEPIVVVAKVLGIAPDVLQRILLFLNPVIARSVHLVYELSTLYEAIEADAARTLVELWRAADPKRAQAPAFRPLHAGSPATGPRLTTGPSTASASRDASAPAASTAGSRQPALGRIQSTIVSMK